MRRRRFLGAAGGLSALAAGCLGGSDAGSGPGPTTRSSATASASRTTTREGPTGYRLAALSSSSASERPPEQYVLHVSGLYTEDDVERERRQSDGAFVVVAVEDVEPTLRDPLETAILDAGWRSADDPPDGLASLVARADAFRLAAEERRTSYFELTLTHLTPDPAVAFDATVVDEAVRPGDPGAIELRLRNVSSTSQRVAGRPVEPFGVLEATPRAGGAGASFLLWRDYDRNRCVWMDEDEGYQGSCFREVPMTLAPSETVARRYEVLPETTDHYPDHTAPTSGGTYAIRGELTYRDAPPAPVSTLTYDARLTLEAR